MVNNNISKFTNNIYCENYLQTEAFNTQKLNM